MLGRKVLFSLDVVVSDLWVHNTDWLLEVTDQVTVVVARSKELDKANAIGQLCKALDIVKKLGNTIEETALGYC